MALNGALAGLVAITAEPSTPSALQAHLFGALGGILVVLSIVTLDKLKIDDPVGAISVHGVCGIWGTIAVALFGDGFSLKTQIIGTLSISVFAFLFSAIFFGIIKAVMGFRQFLLRGVESVRGEWDLVCMAWNLKRLHALGA